MPYARHTTFSSPSPNSKLCNWLFQGIINLKSSNVLPTSYLKAKFDIGQGTGKKLDPDVVAKGMPRARRPKWWEVVSQQISSFFSRLAAEACQKEVQVTEQDVLAVEEQVNYSTARDTVLSSRHITHPIVVDQYDLCALV